MAKKCLLLALAAMMLFCAAGCNMLFTNEERDNAQVIAKVGETELKKEVFTQEWESYVAAKGYTATYLQSQQGITEKQEFMQTLLGELVQDLVLQKKLEELGVGDLTEAEKAQAEEAADGIRKNLREKVDSEYPKASEEEKDLYYQAMLVSTGVQTGSYQRMKLRELRVAKMQEYLMKDYVPTEAEEKALYDDYVAKEKNAMDASPAYYESLEQSGTLWYIPDGVRYVKNLLIALPSKEATEINRLRKNGKDKEADALLQTELKKIEEEANQAYAEATAPGADFDAVLAKYGDDPGMKAEPGKTKGYLIYQDHATFDPIFTKTGMALANVGDVSKPTASDYGYYIIQYASKPTPGAVPFEDVREQVRARLIKTTKEEKLKEHVETWKQELGVSSNLDLLFA